MCKMTVGVVGNNIKNLFLIISLLFSLASLNSVFIPANNWQDLRTDCFKVYFFANRRLLLLQNALKLRMVLQDRQNMYAWQLPYTLQWNVLKVMTRIKRKFTILCTSLEIVCLIYLFLLRIKDSRKWFSFYVIGFKHCSFPWSWNEAKNIWNSLYSFWKFALYAENVVGYDRFLWCNCEFLTSIEFGKLFS